MRKQSGAVPFLIDRGVVKLVLVTSRGGDWIFPKGGLKSGREPRRGAAREAFEEAGVRGRVLGEEAGRYRYRKAGEEFEVVLFPLEIRRLLPVWEESSFRQRLFAPYPDVLEHIEDAALSRIAARVCQKMKKHDASR